jgi:hypothetical protein
MATDLKPADRRVLYFYGVTQTRPAKAVKQAGVDLKSPIEAIECQGVICWVSRVSAGEFETSLAQNMENLDWLTVASVAHQRAIGALAQQTEILPARFGTVFRDENSLRRHIRGRGASLVKDFSRVKDADEWGVKIFETTSVPTVVPKVNSGKEYLMAKAALLPRKKSGQIPSDELSEFQAALDEVAAETAMAGRISSGQRGLAFQTTLLVKRRNRLRMESVLKKFSKKWSGNRTIECTGPWPPYSFVSQDDKSE